MDKRQIYLDNAATTKICKEAIEAYVGASDAHFGNPSSLHGIGVDAERVIKDARSALLSALYTDRGDVIFTGSGTEANNLAIRGRALAKERFRSGCKIIISSGEHASVRAAAEELRREGARISEIPTRGGELDLEALGEELTGDTVLVSIMLVNNETGAVYDLPRAAKLIKERCPGAYIHVDATQAFLKIPFSPAGIGADMVTVSAHKINGPKGVGALYISERVRTEHGLSPVIFGGGQEMGLRSGTENVPGIAAFAAAASVGRERIKDRIRATEALRDRLIDGIKRDGELSEIKLVEPPMHAPHIVNLTLPNIKSETMLHYLSSKGIYVSSGSACSSNSSHKSAALLAYGKSEAEADCSIRISFGADNSSEDVDAFIEALRTGLSRLARIRK